MFTSRMRSLSVIYMPASQLDINRINLHQAMLTQQFINQDENHNNESNGKNDENIDESRKGNRKEKMYQDIKCAFVYKSYEKTKNKENETTFAAN